MKSIHLNSGTWKYKVGDSNTVIRNPERKSTVVPNYALAGVSFQDWDDNGGAIKPRFVRSYIEQTLLAVENEKPAIPKMD